MFKYFLTATRKSLDPQIKESPELEMFLAIHANSWDETFPNVEIALRLCVTNCTEERSFSKLNLIKNYFKIKWERTSCALQDF